MVLFGYFHGFLVHEARSTYRDDSRTKVMSHCWACVGEQVQSGSMFSNIMFNIVPCSKID